MRFAPNFYSPDNLNGGENTMINTIAVTQGNLKFDVFISDTSTGYTAKNVLTVPGVYEEVSDTCGELQLAWVDNASIGNIKLNDSFYLLVPPTVPVASKLDLTQYYGQLASLQPTARQTIKKTMPVEVQDLLNVCLSEMDFYRTLTKSTNVCVPDEGLKYIDDEIKVSMRSAVKSYFIKPTDNQEVLQENETAPYSFSLPFVDAIHLGDSSITPLDVLRVIAPYRRQGPGRSMQYSSIYHTPFYKTDPRLRGQVPTKFNWINGMSSCDVDPIQGYERHMSNNLVTYVCMDTSRNIEGIVTGMFLQTKLGRLLRMLAVTTREDSIDSILSEAKSQVEDGCVCDFGKLTPEVLSDVTSKNDAIANAVTFTDEFVLDMLHKSVELKHTVVDIDSNKFVVPLDTEQKNALTSKFVDAGIITKAMYEFLIDFAASAYAVNWGHTGLTEAITPLCTGRAFDQMDTAMGAYLTAKASTGGSVSTATRSDLNLDIIYPQVQGSFGGDDDDDEDSFVDMSWYISPETAARIRENTLRDDYFNTRATGSESTAVSTIERRRSVDGDNNLRYFISKAYQETCDYTVLINAVIRLLRWGSKKPKTLVIVEHKEINTVFDLCNGVETENTSFPDDSQIILANGCKYQFKGPLTMGSDNKIVGFELFKDLGSIRIPVLASWSDMAEFAVNNMDVKDGEGLSEFCAVVPCSLKGGKPIVSFESERYQFYQSEGTIRRGLTYQVPPEEMSDISLLVVPGVMMSSAYIRSLNNDVLVTIKDRQYDILHRYTEKVNAFYNRYKEQIESVENSKDLREVCLLFNSITDIGEKQEANTAYAGQALNQMKFEETALDNRVLSGPFTLIHDKGNASGLLPMDVTDPRIQKIAHALGDRLIFLAMETPTEFILCKKDLTQEELKVTNMKISCLSFTAIKAIYEKLLSGTPCNVNLQGAKKKCILHESLGKDAH